MGLVDRRGPHLNRKPLSVLSGEKDACSIGRYCLDSDLLRKGTGTPNGTQCTLPGPNPISLIGKHISQEC